MDTCAREYAISHGIKLTKFESDYAGYGRGGAPLRRDSTIIENADLVPAFWDGKSHGTKYTIDKCKEMGIIVRVYTTDKTIF